MYATSHEVYLGAEHNAVADANQSSSEYRGSQEGTAFYTGGLDGNTTYYWRVDEVNGEGRAKGPVWRFGTGNPKPRACFAGGTSVWVDGGLVEISQVSAGHKAGRLDCLARTSGMHEIEEVQEHEGTYDCYELVLASGEVITVADEHYFLVDAGF